MVYKKYIKRGGKVFGPYYYESYRDESGNVKTRYLENYKSGKRFLMPFILISLIFIAVAFGVVFIKYNLIGFVVQEEEENSFEEEVGIEQEEQVEEQEIPALEGITGEIDEEIIEEQEDVVGSGEEIEQDLPELEEMEEEETAESEEIGEEDGEISENLTEEVEIEPNFSEKNETSPNISEIFNESEKISENITIINETEQNITEIPESVTETPENVIIINETEQNISEKMEILTKRAKIVINRPVKWIKTLKVENLSDLEIELPKIAENISILTGREVQEALDELEDYENVIQQADREEILEGTITGLVSLDINNNKGLLQKIWDWLISWTITGDVISEDEIQGEVIETVESKIINVEKIVDLAQEQEIAVEYYTSAPTTEESEIVGGKRMVIWGPDDIEYEDVLAYSELDNAISIDEISKIKLYWYVPQEEVEEAEEEEIEEEPEEIEEVENIVEEVNVTKVNITEIEEEIINETQEQEIPGNQTQEQVEENQTIDEAEKEDKKNKTKEPKEPKEPKNKTKITGKVVSELWEEEEIQLIKQEVGFEAYDLDEDGMIDYIEWNVPYLSEQIYEIIYITKAIHLDENREFVSDIYEQVKEKDDNWSEGIGSGEYVRVTFEIPLDNTKDITVYARRGINETNNSSAEIEVYTENSTELITTFENITVEDWYKTYLTNLPENESYDTFDLKVIGVGVEFDYIVDPSSDYGDFVDNGSLSQILHGCGEMNATNAVYTMNQSLNTSATCFNVTANNITVDFAGFNITEDETGSSDYGVYNDGYNETTIKNGYISGFYNGIFLLNNKNNNITNMTANDNWQGIYLTSSSNNTITNNTANSNVFHGILLVTSLSNTLRGNTANLNEDGEGIWIVSSSNNNQIINNTANLNDDSGIKITQSSNNTITNNTANLNNDGIVFDTSSNNTIQDNTANSNAYGLVISTGSSNTIQNNIANFNSYGGIRFYSSSNNTVTNTTANSNSVYGIYLSSSSNNTLTNNNIWNCSTGGAYACISLGNADNNIISGGTINLSATYGVKVDSNSDNNNISVTSYQMTSADIFIQGDNNRVNGSFNSNVGIEMNGANKNLYLLDDSSFTTTAFEITANNVTIDFAGFNITGPAAGINYGVYNDGYNYTTVKNGKIYDFQNGINFENNQNNNITNITTTNTYGIYLSASSNNTIQNNTANSNIYGIYLVSGSNNNRIINNTANSNLKYGIMIYYYSSNTTVTNNNLWNCSTDGEYACIRVDLSDYNVFDGNKINLSIGYGVWIYSNGAGAADNSDHNVFKNTNMTNIAGTSVFLDDDGTSTNTNNTLLNFSYNNETVDTGGELIRKWYLDVLVLQGDGSGLSSANVTGKNVTEDVQFSVLTNSSGNIVRQEPIEYINTGGAIAYYTNYSITASKSGFVTGSESLNLTSSVNISITIKKDNAQACSSNLDCESGYCVHGVCRPSSIYCGDGFCDTGESCSSCVGDCGECGGGGGAPAPEPEPEPEPEIPASVECSDWGTCDVDYDFEDLSEGVENLRGEQKRYCEDKNNVIASFYETRECSVEKEIFVNKTVVDGEDYVDIYDEESKRLVSRIRDRRGEEEPSLDISFLTGRKFQPDYCFDGVLDGDETEIDCGGSCKECVYETYSMNWFQKLMWLMGF